MLGIPVKAGRYLSLQGILNEPPLCGFSRITTIFGALLCCSQKITFTVQKSVRLKQFFVLVAHC